MIDPVTLLRDLIALRSVNPAFTSATDGRSGERRVAEYVLAVAAKAGLDVELREVMPGRCNLLARLSPEHPCRRRVLLAPHLDTVDATEEQFHPREEAGRLYGRGACDTKGSVAAMLAALTVVARGGRRPRGTEIVFAGLVDEEHAQRGSRALGASSLKADLAIVGEPTRLRVVTAHKGDLWLRLQTAGKAAHGAEPHRGRNAVYAMARVVRWLETDYARRLRRRRHPLLGHATISVGSVSGGTQPNIVPDRCVCLADRRTLPGESVAGVERELRALLRRRGLTATVADSKVAPCEPLETDVRLPLVRQLMACARQVEPAGASFFCDASVLSRADIPSVVFGPGDIAQAHTANEWVSLRAVERATAILSNFLRSLA
jgi:acetylornithine deacetylase/succinyl-diaminopimelate desuccinylase-like protein